MNTKIRQLFIVIPILVSSNQIYAATKVYVPLGSANEIIIIKGDQDRVIDKIIDVSNAHGLAVTPDGKYLIAASMSLAPRNQEAPAGVSEDDHNAHHANSDSQAVESDNTNYISMVDVEKRQVVMRVEADGISHHSGITPDGQYAISTHTTQGTISVIDLINKKLLKTISTGLMPNYVLISADGKYVYVSNSGNNTISEIETKQWTIKRSFRVGKNPEHMVFSLDQKSIYIINVGDSTVSRLSLEDTRVSNIYPVGKGAHGIDLSDDGKTLFVSSKNDNQVNKITISSGKTQKLLLDPMPYHVANITGTGKLYVSSRAKPWIWVLDQNSFKLLRKIPIKGEGHQMVVQR